MASRPPVRRALQDLVRHCQSGLDAPDRPSRLLRSLRRLVPADAAFFATADPESLLFTGGFAEEPLGPVTPLFLDNEFAAEDVNKFAALARSNTPVASLDSVTSGDRLASARYREIMRPLGLGDELRVALRTGAQCWGYVCLHRLDGPSGFTTSELALAAAAAPHLGQALRQTLLLPGPAASGRAGGAGVVVLADDLSLMAATDQASEYLAEMEPAGRLPLPVGIYAAAMALRAIEDGTAAPGTVPTTRIHTRAGKWVTVHAARLTGPSGGAGITVVLVQAGPSGIVSLRLAAHGLSPRESQVAILVLQGAATARISATLHISEHTVQDHLKAVFDKVGVRSRRELVGVMLT